jgi:hypothetical protein
LLWEEKQDCDERFSQITGVVATDLSVLAILRTTSDLVEPVKCIGHMCCGVRQKTCCDWSSFKVLRHMYMMRIFAPAQRTVTTKPRGPMSKRMHQLRFSSQNHGIKSQLQSSPGPSLDL